MLKKIVKATCLLCVLHTTSACSSLTTNKEKTIAAMGAGLVAGALLGAAAKPQGDMVAPWLLLGGASGAAAGGVAGMLLFDETKVSDSLRAENNTLKAQLDIFKKQNEPQLTDSGASLMNAPLPADAKGLVKPGGWKRYKLDRWKQDPENPNVWTRETEMFEIEPPSVGGN